MDGERREDERLPILGTLRGEVMIYQPLTIIDIGLSGATVETTFPLHLDSLHDFRLEIQPSPIIAKGRVVHSRISDVDQDMVIYRSGVEFVDVSGETRAAIAAYAAFVAEGRKGEPDAT